MFKKFNCELIELIACEMYHGSFGIRFYKLNTEIRKWLNNNDIKYSYHQKLTTVDRKNPLIKFHHYHDLISFKMVFSEAIC